AASVRPEPGSNSPQKISEQKSETGREKPETQQTNKPPQTTKACAGVQKLLQRKNKFPQPDGVKNKETKKVEHNHMPTNPSQCSRNTKQHSKKVRVPHTQPAHTNQQTTRPIGRQTNQHTTMHTKNKKYIGTLLSSQTSSTHLKKINFPLTSRWRLVQTYSTQ
ncbi:hypothetical protein RAE02_11180, partial [Corynebacterium tuberculostearicum]